MAMILEAFMIKCCTLLADFAYEEVIMVLGVKDELQKLLKTMKRIRCLLEDAEKRKLKESPIDLWLSELKDVMYDADDIIDLCRIKGNQLLADENPRNETSPVCCNFSSTFSSCFTGVPLRHEIGTRIKELNDRLQQIHESRKQFKLEKSEILESPQITLVNSRQTSSLADPLVVGGEVEVAANELVNLLITDKVEEKCRIFSVAGMGGIGKTTLAQRIFNHPNMQNYFNSKVWICVSQTYSETELLKQVIRKVNGNYGDANTTSELLPILSDSVASCHSLFLVLDDVWRADVWVKLLRIPLQTTNSSVRVLVTTRDEAVAKAMKAVYTHNVMKLSRESCWDMLCKLVFSDAEEQLSDELKELGFDIVERCGCLPLAIKAIAGVLSKRERTKKEWQNILRSDAWSIRDLHHEDHIAALHLSFEDLPSHLKQCFLYFSLYGDDRTLYKDDIARLWVAEGFITENINEGSLMEDVAEKYFNELLGRNLLMWNNNDGCKMHDLVRSLAIFLSKEEAAYGDVNIRNSTAFTKLRCLSFLAKNAAEAAEIFDLAAKQGALRTLFAPFSDLPLNGERLKRISCLRVLDISCSMIKELPDSIGELVHLRYLKLSFTKITAIPESIEHLPYLQFLNIAGCKCLTKLPNGITKLHNLRFLSMRSTSIMFMPKGIEKLQQLNFLSGFKTNNNDTSSKLEDLNFLKQIRTLRIKNLEEAHSEAIILKELPHLSSLTLEFCDDENDLTVEELIDKIAGPPSPEKLHNTNFFGRRFPIGLRFPNRMFLDDKNDRSEEQKLAAEELFDKVIPPQSMKKLHITNFFGRRFPNWMSSTCFNNYVPNLTQLILEGIPSCAELPPLGQLSELRILSISSAKKVKKIGPEFLSGVGFPKLETLDISHMDELEEWSFGAQVEVNASPRLKILPCLYNLHIDKCPLLKQLPEGLKYIPIKLFSISSTHSVKFIEDLPSVEKLYLFEIKYLERVRYLPMLKQLHIERCHALSCVEELNSLQHLVFYDRDMEIFPDWLLVFLQQPGLQNKQDFMFDLTCHTNVLQRCLEGGSYWELIKQIAQVNVSGCSGSYLRYNKHFNIYEAKISIED